MRARVCRGMDTPYSLALFCIVRYIQTLDLYWAESISIKKMKIYIWFNPPPPAVRSCLPLADHLPPCRCGHPLWMALWLKILADSCKFSLLLRMVSLINLQKQVSSIIA